MGKVQEVSGGMEIFTNIFLKSMKKLDKLIVKGYKKVKLT